MAKFEPVLLARVGKPRSGAIDAYEADGGYQAFRKALSMAPADITQVVKDSGLRGRGGAGFPCGLK